MSRRLEVLLHDRLVGHLNDIGDGGVEFRFADSYLELRRRPVLGQKFEDDLSRVHRSRRNQDLPDFFANLVPEGRLRELIETASGLRFADDLDLLGYVGEDLPGAVVVRPSEDVEMLVDRPIQTELPLPSPEPDDARGRLRFSLAGVQLKFSMIREGEKLTLPARDRSGEWIVKFDSLTFPHLPENEYSMLAWAGDAGFDVPEVQLHWVEDVVGFPRRFAPPGSRVLAIRRYDRTPDGRVHQEDFAQAVGLPPSQKYEHVKHEDMALLAKNFIDDEGAEELVRRLVFVIASGNHDAHLKNWSLIYPDRIRARWSPLYDQVATVAWPDTDRQLSLKLAGVKEFHRIDRAAMQRFAAKARIPVTRVLELVDETLATLRDCWPDVPSELSEEHRDAIRRHWNDVPLLREAGPLD